MSGAGMGTSSGTEPSNDDKIMAGVAYLGTCIFMIPTIVIFLMKKDDSDFIKFHCLQCFGMVAACIALTIIWIPVGVLANIPIIGWIGGLLASIVIGLLNLALIGYWIFITIKTFQGETIEIPMLGRLIREKWMN